MIRLTGSRMASFLIFLMFVGGCTEQQLSYSTLRLAKTVNNIESQQILDNLGRFLQYKSRNQDAPLPSMVLITGSTVQVTDLIGLSQALQYTGYLFGATSPNTSDQWSENWVVVPVTDPGALKNLRRLFKYAARMGSACPGPAPLVVVPASPKYVMNPETAFPYQVDKKSHKVVMGKRIMMPLKQYTYLHFPRLLKTAAKEIKFKPTTTARLYPDSQRRRDLSVMPMR